MTKHRWKESKIFPGTERDYWIYVPAQYDPSTPACVASGWEVATTLAAQIGAWGAA